MVYGRYRRLCDIGESQLTENVRCRNGSRSYCSPGRRRRAGYSTGRYGDCDLANPFDSDLYRSIFPLSEYEVLNAKLDDLNAALDAIEQKNDRIYKEFFQLMQSNNEIREELQKEIQKTTGNEGNNSTEKQ